MLERNQVVRENSAVPVGRAAESMSFQVTPTPTPTPTPESSPVGVILVIFHSTRGEEVCTPPPPAVSPLIELELREKKNERAARHETK